MKKNSSIGYIKPLQSSKDSEHVNACSADCTKLSVARDCLIKQGHSRRSSPEREQQLQSLRRYKKANLTLQVMVQAFSDVSTSKDVVGQPLKKHQKTPPKRLSHYLGAKRSYEELQHTTAQTSSQAVGLSDGF